MHEMTEDQCGVCYRTFNPEALARHVKICNKVNTKIRKPMDIRRQRLEGIDVVSAATKAQPKNEIKKNNWKEKHADFIRNIRYARAAAAAEERGETVAPPPPSQKPSDHVDCPTCGRSFNPNSAQRHIDFCAEQARRRPNNRKQNSEAAARRDKMKNFKSTFDKKKEQTRTTNDQYSPDNYSTPHSRVLRGNQPAARAPAGAQYEEETHMTRANTQITRGPAGALNKRTTRNVSSARSVPQQRVTTHATSPQQRVTTHATSPQQRVTTHATSPQQRVTTHATSPQQRVTTHTTSGHVGSKLPPFCYECGHKYPVKAAKFCCECGTQRLPND